MFICSRNPILIVWEFNKTEIAAYYINIICKDEPGTIIVSWNA